MNHLPAKCVVDWNFGHSEPPCTDIRPYRISYPKESPQAINEPIDERKKKKIVRCHSVKHVVHRDSPRLERVDLMTIRR